MDAVNYECTQVQIHILIVRSRYDMIVKSTNLCPKMSNASYQTKQNTGDSTLLLSLSLSRARALSLSLSLSRARYLCVWCGVCVRACVCAFVCVCTHISYAHARARTPHTHTHIHTHTARENETKTHVIPHDKEQGFVPGRSSSQCFIDVLVQPLTVCNVSARVVATRAIWLNHRKVWKRPCCRICLNA